MWASRQGVISLTVPPPPWSMTEAAGGTTGLGCRGAACCFLSRGVGEICRTRCNHVIPATHTHAGRNDALMRWDTALSNTPAICYNWQQLCTFPFFFLEHSSKGAQSMGNSRKTSIDKANRRGIKLSVRRCLDMCNPSRSVHTLYHLHPWTRSVILTVIHQFFNPLTHSCIHPLAHPQQPTHKFTNQWRGTFGYPPDLFGFVLIFEGF